MTREELRAAVRAYRRSLRRYEAAAAAMAEARTDRAARRRALAAAVVAATRRGVRQVDISAETGYTPERIRQIVRQAEREEADEA